MTKKRAPSADADKFIVRLPEGMRSQIEQNAKANKRSMNAEVVGLLQQAMEERAAAGTTVSGPAAPGTPAATYIDVAALAAELAPQLAPMLAAALAGRDRAAELTGVEKPPEGGL